MKRNAKIGLYYIFMFFMMCTLIYLIELKSNYDVSQSYEKSEYSDFVLVPKNLEVLGTTSNVNFFKVIYETLTDELLMVLFLIISTIPLIIYYSAKYIERLDEETNELIDISNTEYLACMKGISVKEFESVFGQTLEDCYGENINRMKLANLLVQEDDFLRLTNEGIDISNYVFAEILS